jgi:hypothetical protein
MGDCVFIFLNEKKRNKKKEEQIKKKGHGFF